ncbi:UPF0182 family protein [Gemmatimonadota bacterium]
MSDPAANVRKGGRFLLFGAIALGALLLLGRALAQFYIEVLWYNSVGYGFVFWTRILAEWGIKVLVGLLTAVLAFVNFKVVARTVSGIQIRRQFGNLEIAERISPRVVSWGVTVASLLMGLWLGATFPRGAGLRLLLFLKAPEWGLTVPTLQQDVSFFVFGLPIVSGILVLGLALTFLLLSFSAAGYAATGSLTLRGGMPTIGPLPRKHLAILGAVFFLLLAGRFWLSPYFLMIDGNSGVQGIFGFADANARIPGFRGLALLTVAAAGATWWAGFRKRLAPLLGATVAVAVGGLLMVQVYPGVVQRFQVEPNELERESPFIEANLRFARIGFGLDRLQRMGYRYEAEGVSDWDEAAEQFAGLPIWTPDALLTTFQEVEARYRYYDFENVAVDRYPSPSGITPVAVAVREIDPAGIEDPNWQNLHLRTLVNFLAGKGAVVSAANRRTPEGRPPMFLSGIPPVASQDPLTPLGMELDKPSVYFGSRTQAFAILTPEAGDNLEGPDQNIPRGIQLGGLVRKLALAWGFRDATLLFASEVSPESQFVFRRSVAERASAMAPFLSFLEAPYPVITQGKIVWVLEGFTRTQSFPLSVNHDLPQGGWANYLRNSVKVTVDAVTGETLFYRVDRDDPLLDAWSLVFPRLLRPLEEMPPDLQAHIRYPRSLLDLQARVLLQYHQETPPRFHGQQDVWARPQELAQGTRPEAYVPEYGLYRLPGEEEPEFLLTTVFVPAGRQNLTGILVARCDPERYGELLLFDIAVEEQVPGPRQVEALVEQDPVISQQFSLWRQGGSQVWSGHLHVVPVGSTLLYLEPIFLAAEADAIPELRRFVVSDGRRVAMEETLEQAITALALAAGDEEPSLTSQTIQELETSGPAQWPAEALELLDVAETRLREGDWAGFGVALDQLRTLLRGLSSGGSEG